MSVYVPFTIKAHLLNSVAFDTRFGVGLDSLLASSLRNIEKRRTGLSGRELDGGLATAEVTPVEIPLGKCVINKELWHWNATMATVVDINGKPSNEEEVGFFIQHADVSMFEQASDINAYPATISEKRGRYRARKTPIAKTMGKAVLWHAVGDPEAVYGLLKGISSIGQRRGSGEGAILSWEVEETSPENSVLFSHSIDNATLSRPCSTECIDTIEEKTGIRLESDIQRAGLRPPYWHFGNMETVETPPFRFS